MTETNENIRETVRDYYSDKAVTDTSCCSSNDLYDASLLTNLPSEVSNFTLGCGNPISAAQLQLGETVLDLGSGGGLDCFLAAREVGPDGFVFGVDMTPEMLKKARRATKEMEIENVEFRKGYLEDLPIENDSIDVVISNCVINLSPDKSKVFAEIARVLKPGGRIAVSDIVSEGEIAEEVLQMADSWSSCAAGALPSEEFAEGLTEAGLIGIEIRAKDNAGGLLDSPPQSGLYSALITAQKPL
jgi:SAM-dependent methyltransferase